MNRFPKFGAFGQIILMECIMSGIYWVITDKNYSGYFLTPEVNSEIPDSVKEKTAGGSGFLGFYDCDDDSIKLREYIDLY